MRDKQNKEEMWQWLWKVLYTSAFRYCRGFTEDDFTAKEMANNAFGETWKDIEGKMSRGEIAWMGEKAFIAYVRKNLMDNCRDETRRLWRVSNREVSSDGPVSEGEEEIPLLDCLGVEGESPEEDLLRVDTIRSVIRTIAATREMLRRAKTQARLLAAVEEYLRFCLVRAAPDIRGTNKMTSDELLRVVELENFEVNKEEMYQFLKYLTGMTRNEIYVNMSRAIERVLALLIVPIIKEQEKGGKFKEAR